MAPNYDIDALVSLIPIIKADRNYWFIRTGSGEFYEDFIKNKFISVGYNKLSLEDIAINIRKDRKGLLALKHRTKILYPNTKIEGKIASLLTRFVYDIKKDDVVLIPSIHSNELCFGIVTDSEAYNGKTEGCPYNKRKKIAWKKRVLRSTLDAELYKLMFTHSTLSSANNYAKYIDRTLNDFFIKGDEAHAILRVKSKEKIDTDTFYDFGDIFKISNDFIDENTKAVKYRYTIQSNVQSPGIIEIVAGVLGLGVLGVILISIAGGGFNIGFSYKGEKTNTKLTANVKTDGIIEKIRTFLNSKSNRKDKTAIVKKAMDDMEITTPEDLVKIIEQMMEK